MLAGTKQIRVWHRPTGPISSARTRGPGGDCESGIPAPGPVRVLYVADRPLTPPRDGTAAVNCKALEALAARYPLSCLIVTNLEQDLGPTEAMLQQLCRSYVVVREQPSWLWLWSRALVRSINGTVFAPYFFETMGRKKIWDAVRSMVSADEINVVIVSQMSMVFVIDIGFLKSLGVACILDIHDDVVRRIRDERHVIRSLCSGSAHLRTLPFWRRRCWRHRLSLFSTTRARQQESDLVRPFDRILFGSFEELARYRASAADPERFCHIPWPIADEGNGRRQRVAVYDAGFVGGDTAFNIEGVLFFLYEVLPLVRRRRPDFRFLLAGQVAVAVRALGRPDQDFESRDSLAEMSEFYATVGITVVPMLHGTGVSIKTLEALSYGCPIVTTPVGARGLSLLHGKQVVVAETAEAFADGILALGRSPDTRARLAASGRAWVLQNHGPQTYVRTLAGVIGRVHETTQIRSTKCG